MSSTFVKLLTFIVISIKLSIHHVSATACRGCIDLDEISFDRTVKRFPYSLIKFDIAYPYGEKHEAFAVFSREAQALTDELMIGTVGIKDYGENENQELGLRFKIDQQNFPGICLFKRDPNVCIPLPSHLDVTLENLKSFVSQNTELYIGNDGCLKSFNDLAKHYANLPDEEQLKVLQNAQRMSDELENETEKISAKNYLIYMQKIHEQGYDFVEKETKRLLRLKAGKVTDAKKIELKRKLNVLDTFHVGKLTKTKKEDL